MKKNRKPCSEDKFALPSYTTQEERLAASSQLLAARHKMATEVLLLINELFTEFFSTAAATICGMILRDSEVITQLSNELTWSMLPLFLVVQFGPEVLDAWAVLAYLHYLGVDWLALGKSFFSNSRFLLAKPACILCVILYFFSAGISSE